MRRRRSAFTSYSLILATLTAGLAPAVVARAQQATGPASRPSTRPAKQFAHPDRIRYDGHCLTIDGKDTFIFSGAFHYFRVPKELWRDRFAKIKAAGFNCVETYAAWNWHERDRPAGLEDRSKLDLTDLKDWLKMAHEEFGLYTIVRPGPYICAEWAGGGFPQWLWTFQPKGVEPGVPWVRTDDPTFLAWSKHWLDAVTPVIAAEQITRKAPGQPGTILFQIENEYDFGRSVPAAARVPHLRFLYENARANGIEVPIFTCWTRQARGSSDDELSQVFDGPNLYSRWNMAAAAREIQAVRRAQPDAPAMVPELQGGWFSEGGGMLSEEQDGVDAAQCNAITLTTIANGASILNYYMLVGGSNFGTWGSRNITQTYDYNAPIRETGGVTEKYAAVTAIGRFLAEQGPAVARSTPVRSSVAGDAKVEVTVRAAADGGRFVFCRNLENAPQDARLDVKLDDGTTLKVAKTLPPRVVLVLHLPAGKTDGAEGQWYCEPGPTPARPATMPASVRIADAWARADDVAGEVRSVPRDEPSLIRDGVLDVGDVVYRATPKLSQEQAEKLTLFRVESDEPSRLVVRANDRFVFGRRAGPRVDFDLSGILRAGDNRIELFYENHGVPCFGDGLNQPVGVGTLALAPAAARGRPLEQWRVAIVDNGVAAAQRPEVAPDFDDSAWPSFPLDEKSIDDLAGSKQPGHPPLKFPAIAILNGKDDATAVYRTTIDVTAEELAAKPLRIELEQVDDEGELFVNGKSVGRTRDYRRPLAADVTDALRPGQNAIAVVVHNRNGDGGMTRPASLFKAVDTLPLDRGLATQWKGEAEHWADAKDATGWDRVALDAATPLAAKGRPSTRPAAPARTMRKWFRAEFELPADGAGEWVPWAATIDASGDGFVYLNGHNLGRYYDVGPQRRFWLPEPWLKRGPGARNVLTMTLHPMRGEPALNGLALTPYADQAERR